MSMNTNHLAIVRRHCKTLALPVGRLGVVRDAQVALTTYDTPSELEKIARWHPSARVLLRIRADDPAARCQLGNKYGADPGDATALLKVSLLLE